MLITGLLSIGASAATMVLAALTLNNKSFSVRWLQTLVFVSIVLQGLFVHQLVDTESGQNLSLFNMLNFTNWLAMNVLLINSFKRNMTLLFFAMSLFALITSTLSLVTDQQVILQLKGQWASLLHIFTAMTAMGFLFLAALQAVLLAYADHQLRSHPTHMPSYIPPIQSLESFLFQLIVIGFLLMSSALLIAFISLQTEISQQPLHKQILSFLAWITFATLLIGHKRYGWRGLIAAKWTITGFALLSLGYFGSKLVIELILKN